jgi:hypothetical protein
VFDVVEATLAVDAAREAVINAPNVIVRVFMSFITAAAAPSGVRHLSETVTIPNAQLARSERPLCAW